MVARKGLGWPPVTTTWLASGRVDWATGTVREPLLSRKNANRFDPAASSAMAVAIGTASRRSARHIAFKSPLAPLDFMRESCNVWSANPRSAAPPGYHRERRFFDAPAPANPTTNSNAMNAATTR